jgi:hypothetical protein
MILESPGLSQKELCARVGGMKAKTVRLLEEGIGTLWTVRTGQHRAKLFYPLEGTCSLFSPKEREQQNRTNGTAGCSRTTANNLEQQNNVSCSEKARTSQNSTEQQNSNVH